MKSVDILTAQKVSLKYELASLLDRVLAWMLDAIIISILYTVLFMGAGMLALMIDNDSFTATIMVLVSIPLLFYHLIVELIWNGRSPGKMAVGLQVVKLSGEKLGMNDYFLRWMFRISDITLSAGGLAMILIATSNKSQRVGDALANTTVVRLRQRRQFSLKSILEIRSLENYEPSYPEVKLLSEKDVLLIKEIRDRYRSLRGDNERQLMKEMVQRICSDLRLPLPANDEEFLSKIIQDYLVLTR